MIEPTLAKIIVVLVVLAMLGGLLDAGQALADPAEYQRRKREERQRKRELDKKSRLYGCGLLLGLFFLCVGFGIVRGLYEAVFSPAATPTAGTTPGAGPPVDAPLPAPLPHAPLVEGRPENLRGLMVDGCTLLSSQEVSARVGRPLIHDVISLLRERDQSVHCAYVDRFVRHPQRPQQEVSVQLVSSSSLGSFGPEAASTPDDPEGLRWWKPRGDWGVWVAVPTPHGLQILVNVALRHLKASPGKRTAAERSVARQLALVARERAPGIPSTALKSPPTPPTPRGVDPDAWFPSSRSDLVYQDGPTTARTYWTVLETLARLRADFGTRVKVVVLDEDKDRPALEPESFARALEEAFGVGRADTGPRKDGALVLVDLATHRAWFFLGPGAPALMRARNRPFPQEWHGKDLTLWGTGVATRVKALAAAYTQAYAAPRPPRSRPERPPARPGAPPAR